MSVLNFEPYAHRIAASHRANTLTTAQVELCPAIAVADGAVTQIAFAAHAYIRSRPKHDAAVGTCVVTEQLLRARHLTITHLHDEGCQLVEVIIRKHLAVGGNSFATSCEPVA